MGVRSLLKFWNCFLQAVILFEEGCSTNYGVVMEISERVSSGTFEMEPLRWIVERTWAWLDNARSLTRDYERLPENHAGMVYVVMIRLMLRRLTQNHTRWQEKMA
jgi:putative transposase